MIAEPLGFLADITAAVIVMFIFPLLIVNAMQERSAERFVKGDLLLE